MNCKLKLLLLFGVILRISCSSPGADTESATDVATTTVKDVYEFNDILEDIAIEFVFVVAGDHVLLPPPKSEEDLRRLHTNARVLAKLITKLHCSQRVYTLLNNTTQEVAVDLWVNSDGHDLLPTIFDKVIQRFESDQELFTEFLKERHVIEKQPLEIPQSPQAQKKHRIYEITVDEVKKSEKLLQSSRVKAMLLSIQLLKLSEEVIVGKSASTDRIVTAKAVYYMAQNIEIRDQVQSLFDQTVDEYLDQFNVMTGGNVDEFVGNLRKKIKDNVELRGKLEEIERNL